MSATPKLDKKSNNDEISVILRAREKGGIERSLEPVQIGIPFQKGALYDASKLVVRSDSGETIPFSIHVSDTWSDGSIRWILCDMQVNVPAHREKVYTLEKAHSAQVISGEAQVKIEETAKQFIVQTGAADFFMDRRFFLPFKKVSVGGVDFNIQETSGMVLQDDKGNPWSARIESSCIEQANHLRATLYFDGNFSGDSRGPNLRFIARCFYYAGKHFARIDFTLWNTNTAEHPGGLWDLGDQGSVFFRDLTLKLSAGFSSALRTLYKTEAQAELSEAGDILIYQDSSGGENWRSRNHMNRHGEIPISFRGYRVSESGIVRSEGLRASPVVAIVNGTKSIRAALRHFWQNFPSAIQTNGDVIKISLFPKHFNDLFELQGGERKTQTVYLDFVNESASSLGLERIHDPLIIQAPPAWYATSGACRYLVSETSMPSEWPWPEIRRLKDTAVQKGSSFKERREIIDEYGWRNFGDQYADHENLLFDGDGPVVSHYNNQYDLIYSFLQQSVATGNPDWFQLAEELVQHVMDIDIYHTERDTFRYNHGLFWHTDHFCDAHTSTHRGFSRRTMAEKKLNDYGGGPSYEHLYAQGLLFYYFLKGDPRAGEAFVELVSYVRRGLNGPDSRIAILKEITKNTLKWLQSLRMPSQIKPYGLLEGPGRASGNGLSVLVEAFLFTKKTTVLREAEDLIRLCAHPHDKLESRNLKDVNMRWSYTVFLQALGKYLSVKEELNEMDYMYYYTKETLLHYATWMERNERPFLDRPEIIDFPNFATRAATDIRKSHVLLLAAKYSECQVRKAFERKASFFLERSMKDILADETATWTRPLAILLQNMNLPLYTAVHPETETERVPSPYMFEPMNTGSAFEGLVKENVRLLKRLFANRKKGRFSRPITANRVCACK